MTVLLHNGMNHTVIHTQICRSFSSRRWWPENLLFSQNNFNIGVEYKSCSEFITMIKNKPEV